MKHIIIYSFAFVAIVLFTDSKSSFIGFQEFTKQIYDDIGDPEISYECFHNGAIGYYYLLHNGKLNNDRYLSIADMTKSANVDRFYLIDMLSHKLIYKSLIAHGKNTGDEFAKQFSNVEDSNQSSFGFYTTAESYIGDNGLSMRINGLEYCNNNARKRDIVMHKADYVSHKFISENGRLGRSLGCPVISEDIYEDVIKKTKNGSCLFIYYTSKEYLRKSQILKNGGKIKVSENGDLIF